MGNLTIVTRQENVHVNTGFIILIVSAGRSIAYGHRAPEDPQLSLRTRWHAFGLLYHLHAAGMNGLIFSLSGILAGAGLLLLFHLLGGMGAGDVKLMAAVGAILGPTDVFTAFLYSALIGGLYALVVLYRHGALQDTCWSGSARRWRTGSVRTGHETAGRRSPRCDLPRLCYGMAISLGTVLCVLRPL